MNLYRYHVGIHFAECASLTHSDGIKSGNYKFLDDSVQIDCSSNYFLKFSCPTCREVCHVTAENAAENVVIKALALTFDPDGYALRLAETMPEKVSWNALYPIFYYNATMFPGSRLNLHLFEPRYKLMMQRIVNSTRSFAYVPNFTNYNARVGEIALVAELKEVEFLPGIFT